MANTRCRRCGTRLDDSSAFCGRCGTRQRSAPVPANRAAGRAVPGAPGWFADPFARHNLRYWNGEIWTEHVYSSTYEDDLLSIDNLAVGRVPDGAWRASFGSLALSILGLLVAFALSILFVLPLVLTRHRGGPLVLLVVSEGGLWAGLFGTCYFTSRRYGNGSVRLDFRLRFRWIDLLIGFVAAIVARCCAAVVLLPFVHVLQSAGNPDSSLFDISKLGAVGWIVLALVTCVGAPLFEELYFRGLLQGQLVERFGPTIGVGVTSLVFGAAHIANDPGIAGLLLALTVGTSGIVLGVVRHLTGRLGSSMMTHAMFNATALLVLAFSTLT